jgi:hypothetical protein
MSLLHVFDPGVTTGYALLEYDHEGIVVLKTRTFPYEPQAIWEYFVNPAGWLSDPRDPKTPVTYLIEEFRLRDDKLEHLQNNVMPASIVRGWIEMMLMATYSAYYIPDRVIAYQQPSAMAPFKSTGLMKERLGLSKLPVSEHERDALRHGLYFYFSMRSKKVRAEAPKVNPRPPTVV